MNQDQFSILEAAYQFKLRHARFHSLKIKRDELEREIARLREKLNQIDLERERIQISDNGYQQLADVILGADFDNIKD